MWDKADIRIPFDDLHVTEVGLVKGQRAGHVPVQRYDFPLFASVAFTDGKAVYTDTRAQTWGAISSGISDMAVGFHPQGFGLYPWPHVSIKASPNKILQGHNVFGTENIRQGIAQMLANLAQAFPKIWAHLDIERAEIRYLDSTYSAFVESDYQRNQVLRVFESLFPNKDSISRHKGYLQGNKNSEYRRQKIYYKAQELAADFEQATRKNQKERAAILGNPKLQGFAFGRMRFEATTGYRGLEVMGIPTNLKEFLTFHDWFQDVHDEPLCRYLWQKAFTKYFDQLRGHQMKNVDDDAIKLRIDAKHTQIKDDGKVCRRRANAIWKTYRAIKTEGYDQLARENNQTFFRNVKLMEEAGISRAFLKSLDPHKPNENVVPLVQIINVDFGRQRPSWYVEPVAGFKDSGRHLRLVS